MQNETNIRLRDRREPGHFWADNEIFDVFGDELGANGIGLYMTLARLAMGTPIIRASLRGLGIHARMSHSSASRAMQVLVRIGLVLETKSEKSRAVSTYTLTNAKELAREYIRNSVRQTVSVGDSCDVRNERESLGVAREMSYFEAYTGHASNCLPERQFEIVEVVPEIATDVSLCETDLSQKTPNLSHHAEAFNTKNKKEEKELPPTPHWGGKPETADPDGRQRGYWETTNRIRFREGRHAIAWEAWVDEQKRARQWPVVEDACAGLSAKPELRARKMRPSRNSRAVIGIFRGT